MAGTPASDVADGPVLSLLNKRLRALRKKLNRIAQMEDAISQGKPIKKEQEDVLRSKPSVLAAIDELEKLRQPLAASLSEELSLAASQHHHVSADSATATDSKPNDEKQKDESSVGVVEDLLNLLYFGSLFDVKSQSDFTSTMLTRTHERGCCLTYDTVTDDATDLLGEQDLDLISALGCLLISRPVDSSLSHKNALGRCIEHAKLWLAKSEQSIEPNSNFTYAGLRERLNKIMGSDYFTTTPEMKAPVEVAAAAAAGNYAPFQIPVHGSVVPVQVEGSIVQFQQEEEDASNFHGHETGDGQSSPVEEFQKDEQENENPAEAVSGEQQKAEVEQNHQIDAEAKDEQYVPRRHYQNQRGGRGIGVGGGRRGYANGRGGRIGGRGGGGAYQNGRNQYYDQQGNYYARNYYYNRGRGGRGGGGGQSYYSHVSGVQGGHAPADGS